MEKVQKTKREKYIDKLNAKLKEWDRNLDKLERKIDREFDQLKDEYRDTLGELKELRTQLDNKLEKLEDAGEEAFESIKKDAGQLWEDASSGLEAVKKELTSG